MRKLLLNISVIALSTTIAASVMAQENSARTPIFINKYSPTVPTYESNVPNLVRSSGQSQYSQATRTYTTPNRGYSAPQYDDPSGLLPANAGRIRSEQDFYDSETKQYYGQYEYFKLLASRGETAKLKEVVQKVQSGGVFDPAKYQSVMSGTQTGGSQSSTSAPRQVVKNTLSKTRVSNNLKESDLPQKVHQGYDEPTASAPVRQKNQPLFLR